MDTTNQMREAHYETVENYSSFTMALPIYSRACRQTLEENNLYNFVTPLETNPPAE